MSMAADKDKSCWHQKWFFLSYKPPDQESNLGLLGARRERYLGAMRPPTPTSNNCFGCRHSKSYGNEMFFRRTFFRQTFFRYERPSL